MRRASLLAFAAACYLTASSACGSAVDLTKALEVTDLLTGYYDAGVKNGKNYLVPSVTFRLRNKDTKEIGPVQFTVSYWKEGAEWDSVLVQAIGAAGLAGGATTASILARNPVGYTLEGARADFFSNSLFKDVTAKMFASRSGIIVKIGEFPIDRRILPHVQ